MSLGGFGTTEVVRVDPQAVFDAVALVNRAREIQNRHPLTPDRLFLNGDGQGPSRLITDNQLYDLMTELADVPKIIEERGLALFVDRTSPFADIVGAIVETNHSADTARADIRAIEKILAKAFPL